MSFIGNLLLGKEGGLTKRELVSMVRQNPFSRYLPYLAYDEASGIYLNTDHTAGLIWECSPLCFAGEKTPSILEGLFRIGFPEGTVLQFILHADSFIEPFVDLYTSGKAREDSVARSTTEAFRGFLLEGTEGLKNLSGIPLRNFRLFVTAKIPLDGNCEGLDLGDIKSTIEECLRGAQLYPVHLRPGDLLDLLRRFFNDEASIDNSAYDEKIPLRKQVIKAESVIRKSGSQMQIGGKILRCITPKRIPKEVDLLQTNQLTGGIWGTASDSDQIRTPFMLTYNVIFQNLRGKLHRKCNLVLQQHGVGSFAPSLARKKEEYLWAVDEIEKGTNYIRLIPVLWVWGKSDREVSESITRAKRIWESQGYIMQEDRGILPILLISSLPFGLYSRGSTIDNLDRDFISPADSVSVTLPVQADFTGGGRPVLIFAGRKGQVCGIDVFDERANNHNMFIAAGSGSGKSFLVNYLASNYYAENAMVRIIDIGGSYKKMTRMFGARFLDFSERSDICLNPFSRVSNIEDDLSVIASVVLQMIYSSTDSVPEEHAETAMTLIKAAVKWAYRTEGSNADINTVFEYLNTFPRHAEEYDFDCPDKAHCVEDFKTLATTLAFNLTEFTTGHAYGRWFNGRATFDISRDEFVVLELEHLKPQRELFKVVTLQVINAVTQDLYLSDRSRPRLIIFDEAWQFMKEGAVLKEVIEEGYRRARKYGGSFTVITQSLLDLKKFGTVGDVILANSAFKFYLESDDFDRANEEKLIEYDDFTMRVLKSIRTNKPHYSEIFMDTPFGSGAARLAVDSYSYYVNTSAASEIAEIEALVGGGMSYGDAIHEMVKRHRS